VTSPSDDATVQFGSDEATESSRSGPTSRRRIRRARPSRTGLQTNRRRLPIRASAVTRPSSRSHQPTRRRQWTPTRGRRGPARSPPTPAWANRPGRPRATPSVSTSVRRRSSSPRPSSATRGFAAAAETPRQTREHLETAREAAETLEAAGYCLVRREPTRRRRSVTAVGRRRHRLQKPSPAASASGPVPTGSTTLSVARFVDGREHGVHGGRVACPVGLDRPDEPELIAV